MNTALPNSVRNIELDVTEIIQMLAALSDRFKNQFLLKITDEDVKMIQKRMVEQSDKAYPFQILIIVTESVFLYICFSFSSNYRVGKKIPSD